VASRRRRRGITRAGPIPCYQRARCSETPSQFRYLRGYGGAPPNPVSEVGVVGGHCRRISSRAVSSRADGELTAPCSHGDPPSGLSHRCARPSRTAENRGIGEPDSGAATQIATPEPENHQPLRAEDPRSLTTSTILNCWALVSPALPAGREPFYPPEFDELYGRKWRWPPDYG
jgi:hypothetical protein